MPDLEGKGTTLTELLKNRPGSGWGYNILDNEYVPPKGKAERRNVIWLNAGGRVFVAWGTPGQSYQDYTARDMEGNNYKVKDAVRMLGQEPRDIGKAIKVFSNRDAAMSSAPSKTSARTSVLGSPAERKPEATPAEQPKGREWAPVQTNSKGVGYVMVPKLKRAITADDVNKLSPDEQAALWSVLSGKEQNNAPHYAVREAMADYIRQGGSGGKSGTGVLTRPRRKTKSESLSPLLR